MKLGERIEARLKQLGMSQAELARRVGVRQSTMHSLIKGDSRSTRSLHQIAIELKTSTAYLVGQVDTPEPDGAEPALTAGQRTLLDHFGELGQREQTAIALIVGSLASAGTVASAARLPSEDELAVVFEALLDGIDASLPLAERARLLAQRLPIGLSQLQGVVRDPSDRPAPPASAGSPRRPATRVREPQP